MAVAHFSVKVGDLVRAPSVAPSELFAILQPDYRGIKGRGWARNGRRRRQRSEPRPWKMTGTVHQCDAILAEIAEAD